MRIPLHNTLKAWPKLDLLAFSREYLNKRFQNWVGEDVFPWGCLAGTQLLHFGHFAYSPPLPSWEYAGLFWGRKRSCWSVLCSFMVLALPQLAQAAAYLPAQGDVLDTTTYTPGQSSFSLSMENWKFKTLTQPVSNMLTKWPWHLLYQAVIWA